MAAYLVGQITVKNNDLWQEYVAGVQESLAPFDAKVLFRGQMVSILAGKNDHDLVVVIEFADQSTLASWYGSEKYQSLVPLRDEAADVVIIAYDA